MNAKSMGKQVLIVALGVMVAGYAMYQFRDISVVDQSRTGFGG